VIRCEDGFPINFNAWRDKWDRSSGDDDVLGSDFASDVDTTRERVLDLVATDKLALANENVNTNGFKRSAEVTLDGLNEIVGVVGDLLALEGDRLNLDAEGFEVMLILELADLASSGEESFRWNAASVDAGSTVALDDGYFEDRFYSVEGCTVATGLSC